MTSEIRILHIDDEPSFTELTKDFLERDDERFAVRTATSVDEGLEKLTDRPPDCVVSDYDMPKMNGIELLDAVRDDFPDLPFILFTGKGSEAVASDAIAGGVTDYLQKGGGSEQYELLANRIRNAVQAVREAQRADRQERLMRLTEVAGDTGGFEIDIENGEVIMTDGAQRITGLSTQPNPSLDEAISLYHPEDQDEIQQAINRTRRESEQTQGTWRYQHPEGEERLLDITFTPVTANGDTLTIRGVIHDITDQKRRQELLNSEQQFIAQMFDTLKDILYVIDTDGTLQRWNEAAHNVTGYSESELYGMPVAELFVKDERKKVTKAVETVLTDGEGTVKADLLTAEGERLPYEFRGTRLTDDNGEPTEIIGVGRDLTERRQRERRFQALVEESKDNVSVIDENGVFQYQSPAVERILGYQPEETIGDAIWEYIHPDDHKHIKDTLNEWITTPGTTGSVEYRARHTDGSWRWMEANGNNQLDNPAIEGYVVNSRDITDRKEREQELGRTRELMSNMEQLADVGGWEYRPETEVLRTTDGIRRLYELDPGMDLTLEEAIETVHPDDREQLTDRFNACLETGESYEIDVRIGTQSGEWKWVTARGERVDNTASNEVMRGYIQDITERKEFKQELEAQNERLSEFTGIVSHDLRSPLSTAEGRIELAQEECESSHLQTARDAIERGQVLIDDLLTLAEEGERASNFEPVELADVVERCWEGVETGQATLEFGQTQVINADKTRLKQLFENLYRNAVEHGGEGVAVSVGQLDDGFYVADTGSGIPESERENVFDAGYSTADDGTGFGLRIVEQIADTHGWEIAVTESEHGGARFEITGVERV